MLCGVIEAQPAAGPARPIEAPAAAAPAGPPIRVFLLDDHELVRRGLRDVLTGEPGIVVVGEAADAREGLSAILRLRPTVAVLDARLPDGTGIEVCRTVRAADPSIACLILTSFEDDEAVATARRAGAAGYLIKHIRGTALVDALRRIASGQSMMDDAPDPSGQPAGAAVSRPRGSHGSEHSAQVAGLEALSDLTDQERRILALIADGLTNRQIAGKMYLAEKTVKNYVSSLLAKLGLESRTQAAVFATKLRA
ncbi:MAG: response regulator [Frankia sp.]